MELKGASRPDIMPPHEILWLCALHRGVDPRVTLENEKFIAARLLSCSGFSNGP